MKFKIHYSGTDWEDYVVIEGEDTREIREKADKWMWERGLDAETNNAWSEEIIEE